MGIVPEVMERSDGSVALDWTRQLKAGSPAGPFVVLTRAQWLGLVAIIKAKGG
jgi:hypothetical protein